MTIAHELTVVSSNIANQSPCIILENGILTVLVGHKDIADAYQAGEDNVTAKVQYHHRKEVESLPEFDGWADECEVGISYAATI